MTPPTAPPTPSQPSALEQSRRLRIAALFVGLLLPQFVLYGPSLVGDRVLLPLDILAWRNVYLASAPNAPVPHDPILSDLVHGQPVRDYLASEFRAGRVPLWDPLSYAGAPLAMAAKFDPFEWLYVAFPVPITIAWMQLAKAVIAGVGAYLFFSRGIGARALPALIGAWCYPLTGYFIYWQGFPVATVVVWLPWLMLGVWSTVQRPGGWGPVVLSMATGFALLAGHIDITGQALLACGFYSLWLLASVRPRRPRLLVAPVVALVVAWLVGFALGAVYWLPAVEYSKTGDRIGRRQLGEEDRPPAGLSVIPQVLAPEFYGTTRSDSVYLGETGNMPESAATAYAGMLVALLLAPLAWCDPRRRADAWFWAILGLFALSWQLAVPVVVDLLRLPGMNLFSHNRFTFVTGFALVSLAVMGLDWLSKGPVERRGWFIVPALFSLIFLLACLGKATESQEDTLAAITAKFAPEYAAQPPIALVELAKHVHPAHSRALQWASLVSAVVVAGWGFLLWGRPANGVVPILGFAMVAELVITARGASPQSDPALYYPPLPALQRLADAPPGRVLGVRCLHPDLHKTHHIREIRGYDGIDPRQLVEVLDLGRASKAATGPSYAVLAVYFPRVTVEPGRGIRLPGVVNMFDVRYLVVRGQPPQGLQPAWEAGGYAVIENPGAAGRVYVPRRIAFSPSGKPTLDQLAAPAFNPLEVVYVDRSIDAGECAGTARVTVDSPSAVEVVAEMQTPGVVVLADQWYEGWTVTVNGTPQPVLRANHALRGVEVPAGKSVIQFRYEPAGFTWGVRLLVLAVLIMLVRSTWLLHRQRAERKAMALGQPTSESSRSNP